VIEALLSLPSVRGAARRASDWIDLQWSLVVALLAEVAPRARGRLLDVGCGEKPYEHLFTPFVTEYLGIEHEETFAATSASASARKPDLVYDGRRLPFEDRTFDTVLNIQVLEHTPRPQELVAEMARVLKDDGILILSAPFQFRLHEEPHDYFRYSPHGLRVLCADAGLEIVEVLAQGSLWSVLGHKLNSWLAFRVARLGALAQSMGKLPHEGARTESARWWTLPWVAPTMLGIAGGARLLDRVAPDPEEALGFVVIARRATAPMARGASAPMVRGAGKARPA
jgi:SAM-dependent methyltransferase